MKTRIDTMTLRALALSGALLVAPVATALADEGAAAQAQAAAKGEMSGMQGTMPMGGMQGMQAKGGMMSPEMMATKQEMMKEHMTKMEDHMANIEALLRELVELNKAR